ncbi:MAG: TolC family protein [Opitutaceae bacterium]|jgi:outer membrane protein TolC|nr:TolC family protein [Opitutaceae bacterium]
MNNPKKLVIALSAALACPAAAPCAAPPEQPAAEARFGGGEMTFEQARDQLVRASHALRAAEARHAGRRAAADSLKGLDTPSVSLDAEYVYWEKTLRDGQVKIDHASMNGMPLPVAGMSYEVNMRQSTFRPVVTGMWQLYGGGKIRASQRAAAAIADQAGAQVEATREALLLDLVKLYFGQRLAGRVLGLRGELLQVMEKHLADARKLEHGGMITKAQRLQAQVACDAARRGHDSARHELESARIALAGLLRSDEAVAPVTPLFVLAGAVADRAGIAGAAQARNPRIAAAQSVRRAAQQEVKAARAGWLPSVALVGRYNLHPSGNTPLDQDWLAAVAVRWALFDKIDRRHSYTAARQAVIEADNTVEAVRALVDTGTRQACDAVENALRQYLLLESNLESARENLRVQEIAFREGQNTSTDVTSASVALTNVLVERAAAAYRFDVELASLLHAGGRMDQFTTYMNRADKLTP